MTNSCACTELSNIAGQAIKESERGGMIELADHPGENLGKENEMRRVFGIRICGRIVECGSSEPARKQRCRGALPINQQQQR